MNRMATRIAIKAPSTSEVELEVYHEDESGVETTYKVTANIWWHDKDVEFYDFKNETGEEIDEDEFWKMFDNAALLKNDLIIRAIEKAESPAEFMAGYGDYLYDQEKDRKMMEKP